MRILGAVIIVCAALAPAYADSPQQQADKLFAEGRDLVAKGNNKAACDKFEAAIKLDATATGTMLNLGLCYENLGKFATSIRWFRKAQAAAYEGKQAEYEAAAKDHTKTLTDKVSILAVEVEGPPDAEVLVDGAKYDATEFGRIEVDAGTHEVVGRAAGKKKVVKTFDLKPGETKPVAIAFTESAIPVYVDRGSGRRKAAIVLGAAGVAAWGFTLFYGLHEKKLYEHPTTPDDDNAKQRLRYIGTSVFIVGTGAVVAAIVLYVKAPGKEQVSDGTAFAPVIAPDNYGFAFSGRF